MGRHRMVVLALVLVAVAASSCAAQWDDAERKVVIVENGSARGWLGVVVEDMTEQMGRRMGVDVTRGALVNDVINESPAERAGLKVDDIIVAVDDRTISDGDDLVRAVRKIKPENVAKIAVVRGSERLTLPVTVGSKGSPRHAKMSWMWPGMEGETALLGVRLRNISGQLAEYFKIPGGRGVLAEEVESASAAATAGLQAGDVIIRFGSEPVRDIDDLRWVLEDAKAEQVLPMEIVRGGSRRTLELKLPEKFSGSDRLFFNDQMFHFYAPGPDADVLRKHIEIEIPHDVHRQLKAEQLELRGLQGSMKALKGELEILGRQLKQEAQQAKKSLQRALRSTTL